MIDFFGSGFDAAHRLGLLLATFILHKARGPVQEPVRDAACDELQWVYGDLGWIVPDLLAQCRTVQSIYFDAVEQVQMPARSIGRVVLVGDACQCVSPLAGQGASMTLMLRTRWPRSSMHTATRQALARFEKRLKPAIERRQEAGRRIANWFVPDDTPHRIVRDLATWMSTWPGIAGVVRRRMAAESVLGGVECP